MELRHLRYFVAVAEEQNVTRAAGRLHVSQPPLSRQIRDLESELQVKLFERSPKALRLTTAGRVFLDEARAVLERSDVAIRTVKAVAASRRADVHVGYAPSLTVEILPRALRLFQNECPAARVSLHDLSTEEMLSGLRDEKLDLALMIDPGGKALRGLRYEELYCYPMRLAVHPSHRLAKIRQVKLSHLVDERLIAYTRADYPEYHERLAEIFRGLRIPQVAEEHDSATSLVAAVEAGRGVALVPSCLECLSGPRLTFRRLAPPSEPFRVGVATRVKVSKSVELFIAAARECKAQPS